MEYLYTAITKHDVDIVSAKMYMINEDESQKQIMRSIPEIEGKHRITENDFGIRYYSQCGKIFKRSLIQEYNIIFPRHLRYGEDLYFTYSYLSISQSIYYIQRPLYYYRKRTGSATDFSQDDTTIASRISLELIEGSLLLLSFMYTHNSLQKYATQLCRLYLKLFRTAISLTPAPQTKRVYEHNSKFWNEMQEIIDLCQDTRVQKEIFAIQQGYYIHTLICDNDFLRVEIYRLYRRSIWFHINYIRYYLLSKLPIHQREHYIQQYNKLKDIKRYRLFSHLG